MTTRACPPAPSPTTRISLDEFADKLERLCIFDADGRAPEAGERAYRGRGSWQRVVLCFRLVQGHDRELPLEKIADVAEDGRSERLAADRCRGFRGRKRLVRQDATHAERAHSKGLQHRKRCLENVAVVGMHVTGMDDVDRRRPHLFDDAVHRTNEVRPWRHIEARARKTEPNVASQFVFCRHALDLCALTIDRLRIPVPLVGLRDRDPGYLVPSRLLAKL